MLTPSEKKIRPGPITVRLTGEQVMRLIWLTEALNMTTSQVIRALVDQEYEAQQAQKEPA
jgi:hypothetical protein